MVLFYNKENSSFVATLESGSIEEDQHLLDAIAVDIFITTLNMETSAWHTVMRKQMKKEKQVIDILLKGTLLQAKFVRKSSSDKTTIQLGRQLS